jgi:hypothetical protein
MQGSYILLAATGIFILIGGGKRIIKSMRLTPITAVIIIIAFLLLNLINPVGNGFLLYFGTALLFLASIWFLLKAGTRQLIGSILGIILINAVLVIYKVQVINRYDVPDGAAEVMLVGGAAIASFIAARNSGQAFAISAISIILYFSMISAINGETIIIGGDAINDYIIYSSLGAVLLNEIVTEFISVRNDRALDLRFEAAEMEEKEITDHKKDLKNKRES